MEERDGAHITIEIQYDKKGKRHELLSCYDENGICECDRYIEDEEIYEMRNPCWLSDIFIFSRKHFNLFIDGEVDTVCFIKVNSQNEIEEMGFDFASRFYFDDYDKLLSRKDVSKAGQIHRILFSMIGDEYWGGLYIRKKASNFKRNNQ